MRKITFIYTVMVVLFCLHIPAAMGQAEVDKMSFWNTTQRGANIFNREITREDIKAAKNYGIDFIRSAPDKFLTKQKDFLIGDADSYTQLVPEDLGYNCTIMRNLIKAHPLMTFFAIAIIWADGIWILLMPAVQKLLNLDLSLKLAWIGMVGPGLAAIVVSFMLTGKQGVHDLFKPLFKWRVGYVYYAYVYLGVLFFEGAASWFTLLLDGDTDKIQSLTWLVQNTSSPLLGLKGLWIFLELTIVYTLCEELGWRGFALPRLAHKTNPLLAVLILGLVAVIWHIPLIYMYGLAFTMASFLSFFLFAICMSVFYGFLYFKTKGSLLICGLFHGSVNAFGLFFPTLTAATGQGVNNVTLSLVVILSLLIVPYLYSAKRICG